MRLLNDMALFVEVVKARGFRKAAEALGMPSSTLSRRISGLEKAIGLRLLHRTTRRIELTEAGQLYFERCQRIVEEARLAHEQLGELLAQPTGVLRASLPVDFATTWLAPLLAEFAGRYPGIRFELDLTPRRVDLVSEPFDVAIRMGQPPDSSLIARPGQVARRGVQMAGQTGQRAGMPGQPAELAQHECLGFRTARPLLWVLHRGSEAVEIAVNGRFQLNSVGLIRRLATLDQGIALLPEGIVAEDLAQGRLQPVLADWQGPAVPVYALTETRLLPAKTQCFIEFLRERLGPAVAV